MDSMELEREKGITIKAKNAAFRWKDYHVNIVDTPGHADFGGEVERILRMVDGVLILVDAAEGPMPQTRFVTRKALALGLRPIVAINKIDRSDAEPLRVHDEVLGLFIDLEATPEQLDAPFLYTSSRAGTATAELSHPGTDLQPLFQSIIDYVPPPTGDPEGPFQMLVSTLDFSTFLGRIAIGRIERGRVRVGDQVALLPLGEPGLVTDEVFERNRVTRLYTFDGLHRVEVDVAGAGDIVALSGFETIEIGRTFTSVDAPERMLGIAVEEPTISVDFIVNNGPFAGREGKYVTSRQLKDRLYRELERNVALRVEETDSPDTHSVAGRGELHLGFLMESMRRVGFEFQVSGPRVIT
jgi:GTP-binding protein